jgi:hypothetical protein
MLLSSISKEKRIQFGDRLIIYLVSETAMCFFATTTALLYDWLKQSVNHALSQGAQKKSQTTGATS